MWKTLDLLWWMKCSHPFHSKRKFTGSKLTRACCYFYLLSSSGVLLLQRYFSVFWEGSQKSNPILHKRMLKMHTISVIVNCDHIKVEAEKGANLRYNLMVSAASIRQHLLLWIPPNIFAWWPTKTIVSGSLTRRCIENAPCAHPTCIMCSLGRLWGCHLHAILF